MITYLNIVGSVILPPFFCSSKIRDKLRVLYEVHVNFKVHRLMRSGLKDEEEEKYRLPLQSQAEWHPIDGIYMGRLVKATFVIF